MQLELVQQLILEVKLYEQVLLVQYLKTQIMRDLGVCLYKTKSLELVL